MVDTIRRSQVGVDGRHLLDAVRAARAATTDARHAAMLDTYLAHMEAEFAADIDAAMHTLVAEPVFRFWCGFRDADGPAALPRPVIRANYERAFASGFPPVEIDVERFLVSDDGLVLQGEQRAVVAGSQLAAHGFDVDPAKEHLCLTRFALIVEFDDDLMVGEDHYWPLPHTVYEIVEDPA